MGLKGTTPLSSPVLITVVRAKQVIAGTRRCEQGRSTWKKKEQKKRMEYAGVPRGEKWTGREHEKKRRTNCTQMKKDS